MRSCLKYFCVICALFTVLSLCGNSTRRPQFTPVKVGFRMMRPPQVKARSLSSASHGKQTLYNRAWGVVEISFTPRFDFDSKRTKNKNNLSGIWLDNVICGVQVIAFESGKSSAPPTALFSTRVDFWTIPADNKAHKYFVYLPPRFIDRVMPARRDTSNEVKIAKPGDFAVLVTFFHEKWGILGEGFYGIKTNAPYKTFRALADRVPASNVFHGSLLSRANSPWGMSDIDEFDLEKPAVIPAPLDDSVIAKAAAAAEKEEQTVVDSSRKSSSRSTSSKRNKKSKK